MERCHCIEEIRNIKQLVGDHKFEISVDLLYYLNNLLQQRDLKEVLNRISVFEYIQIERTPIYKGYDTKNKKSR